jgi:hypothetical protein
MEESKNKIYLIKLFKKLNTYNTKFKEGESIYNCYFLKSIGYICDLDLCDKWIVVYKNEVNKKIIIYLDGFDREANNLLFSFKYLDVLSEVEKYIIRVKNVVEKINISYENYDKLYLGNCLGGFMVNNFISGKNIVGYTYNSFGFKINDEYNLNITNYCQNLDVLNIFWRINNIKQKAIILDSFSDKLNLINLFDIKDICHNITIISEIVVNSHFIYKVDEKIIEILF